MQPGQGRQPWVVAAQERSRGEHSTPSLQVIVPALVGTQQPKGLGHNAFTSPMESGFFQLESWSPQVFRSPPSRSMCANTRGSRKVLSSGERKGGLKDLEKITSKFREKTLVACPDPHSLLAFIWKDKLKQKYPLVLTWKRFQKSFSSSTVLNFCILPRHSSAFGLTQLEYCCLLTTGVFTSI